MLPLGELIKKYHEYTPKTVDPRKRQLAREQTVAQVHLPASTGTDPTPLSERCVTECREDRFGPFSQSFDLQAALEKATRASKAEKDALLEEAARSYESLYEQMTFWEVTSFWTLAMTCSPCSIPMILEAKHVEQIALLLTKQINQEEDKLEIISLIHVLGSLLANRQLKVKIAATRTMDLCSDKLLAELVFLFAQSLKPEKGKEWDADKLSFMKLLVQQIDSAFDCSIYRIVDLFLTDSVETSRILDICMHLISQDASPSSLQAFGHIIHYIEFEVPPDFNPALWKCAQSLDLTQLDEEAIREILAGLFHAHLPREQASLIEPVAFLQKWADILCRAEYKKDVQDILDLLRSSPDFPNIRSKLEDKYKGDIDFCCKNQI